MPHDAAYHNQQDWRRDARVLPHDAAAGEMLPFRNTFRLFWGVVWHSRYLSSTCVMLPNRNVQGLFCYRLVTAARYTL